MKMNLQVLLSFGGCASQALSFFFLLTTLPAISAHRGLWKHETEEHHRPVTLDNFKDQVVIQNGIVSVTLSKPQGDVLGIKYAGIDNVLETNELSNRGYWDVVYSKLQGEAKIDTLRGTDFRVILSNDSQVEVSFSRTWDFSDGFHHAPLNFDKRYIVRRGSSGLYLYSILERLEGWPSVAMDQIRVVFKLKEELFSFMAVSDDRQRVMPMMIDRLTGKTLAYPEAVLLTHPVNPDLRGEVDDKYQYSCANIHRKLHGWISDTGPVGFWMITPSDEFFAGGPMKQDLSSHVGPTVLNMFTSTHYVGKDMNTEYQNGESWKKVLGPVFVYLNSISSSFDHHYMLWEDAKTQLSVEVNEWPYEFPMSVDFLPADQRGSVAGCLLVSDRYINGDRLLPAPHAHVGLAHPGDAGSWQTEAKDYQFWSQADECGCFIIKNILPGDYNLFAFLNGFIGEYKHDMKITIYPGKEILLMNLVFKPPRCGVTLWEIGIPDRTAAEFLVPDTEPMFINKLYDELPFDRYRQYGLWEQYMHIFPTHDLVYEVGLNNYQTDWFYAQVLRNMSIPTTWTIVFGLDSVENGNYTLQLALASATEARLEVQINDHPEPLSATQLIGKDNAIARHGIYGVYRLYSIAILSQFLVKKSNTIHLTQSNSALPFYGVMYDYIRLEGP